MVEESTDTYKEMDKNAYHSVLFETLDSEKGIHPRVYIWQQQQSVIGYDT